MKFYESISNEMDQIIEELQNEKILESKKVYKNIKNQIRGSDNEEILPRLIEIKDNLLRNLES